MVSNSFGHDNDESKMLAKYMKEGKLVPSDLVNKIVRKFILSDSCKDGCILDGYPRTLEQAEYFIENIDANISTIFFDVSDEVATSLKAIVKEFATKGLKSYPGENVETEKTELGAICTRLA